MKSFAHECCEDCKSKGRNCCLCIIFEEDKEEKKEPTAEEVKANGPLWSQF